MRRRFWGLLIGCTLLLSMFAPAGAAGTNTYTLDELGITVSLPSDYIAFTRDFDADDPNLDALGMDKDSLRSLMIDGSIYLDAWDENVEQEIMVVMIDIPGVDFKIFDDSMLRTMIDMMEAEYKGMGIAVTSSAIHQHAQVKFVKLDINQRADDMDVYTLQYYTVYKEKGITIMVKSYTGPITSAQEEMMQSIVDSVTFDTAPQKAASHSTPTSPFTYTDEMTKTTFTVPANWVSTPLSGDGEFYNAKFSALVREEGFMLYGSADIWSEMSASERSEYGNKRANMDSSAVTMADIAAIYGVPVSDVSQVTYGGLPYYKATVISDQEVYGIPLKVTTTYVHRITNGYMFTFAFNGTSDDPLYKDFEATVSSVKTADQGVGSDAVKAADQGVGSSAVKAVGQDGRSGAVKAVDQGVGSDAVKAAGQDGGSSAVKAADQDGGSSAVKVADQGGDPMDAFNLNNLLVSLLITIAVYTLPIIIYRYAIRKQPVGRESAKWITVIYGACAFVAMCVILFNAGANGAPGGAILLWSFINYRILIGGKAAREVAGGTLLENPPVHVRSGAQVPDYLSQETERIPSAPIPNQEADDVGPPQDAALDEKREHGHAEPVETTIKCCHKCANKLQADSLFCNRCGTRVSR